MKRAALIAIIGIGLLSGCASVQDTTRLSSNLQAAEFNSVASRYLERPTFVNLETFSTNEKVLAVQMTTYGMDKYGNNTNSQNKFHREHKQAAKVA